MNVIRTMVKVALAFSLLVLRCSFQMDQNLQENIELLEGGVKKKGCKKTSGGTSGRGCSGLIRISGYKKRGL